MLYESRFLPVYMGHDERRMYESIRSIEFNFEFNSEIDIKSELI
jgi:hypothetical protein